MPFLGIIRIGSDVAITLDNHSTQHAAVVLAGLTTDPANSVEDVAAAQSSATIRPKADKKGVLEIRADFHDEGEVGHLTVRVNGKLRDEGDLSGHPPAWRYSVR